MNDPAQIRMIITAGVLAMVLMSGFIIMFLAFYQRRQTQQRQQLQDLEERHQRELLEASLQSQEAERRRIATHLHDDIGTMLSATRLSLAGVFSYLTDNPTATSVVRETRELLEETVNNVRQMTKELLPTTLDDLGLVVALDELITKLPQTAPNVSVDFHHEGLDQRLSARIELAVYRVAQELIHNSLRHAGASRIELLLMHQADRLLLTVSDDGVGFDPVAARGPGQPGLGLKNIESRLNVIGGHAIFDAAPGKGTYVIVAVPLTA